MRGQTIYRATNHKIVFLSDREMSRILVFCELFIFFLKDEPSGAITAVLSVAGGLLDSCNISIYRLVVYVDHLCRSFLCRSTHDIVNIRYQKYMEKISRTKSNFVAFFIAE